MHTLSTRPDDSTGEHIRGEHHIDGAGPVATWLKTVPQSQFDAPRRELPFHEVSSTDAVPDQDCCTLSCRAPPQPGRFNRPRLTWTPSRFSCRHIFRAPHI